MDQIKEAMQEFLENSRESRLASADFIKEDPLVRTRRRIQQEAAVATRYRSTILKHVNCFADLAEEALEAGMSIHCSSFNLLNRARCGVVNGM